MAVAEGLFCVCLLHSVSVNSDLAKLLEPAVWSVWHSGRRSSIVGRRLLLTRNPAMYHRKHPNNTVSSFSTPLRNISAKGKCVRSIFFILF